jgi:hypothetical protein
MKPSRRQNIDQPLVASVRTSSAEAADGSWASHWLLIFGSLLIIVSAALTWIKFPYSWNVAGFELPAQALVPHIHHFSYGLIGIAVLVLAFFFRKRFRWSLLLGAAILLTDWMLVPGRMAFQQPPLLRRLSEERQAVPVIKAFTARSLSNSYGSSEEIRQHLDLLGPSGRFAASLSFLGLGWYCFGAGSFLVGCYAVGRLPGERMRSSLLLICLPAGVLGILALPPAIGQLYMNRGARARAAGDNKQAMISYRRALKWDRWYRSGIEVYRLIGQLEEKADLAEGSAERAITRAVELRAENQYEPAIMELQHAAEKSPAALAKTVRHEEARMQADWGLVCYQAGEIGPAVAYWKKARAEDLRGRLLKSQPALLYVLPYLARGNFDLGRYQAGLYAAKEWIEITVDHKSLRTAAYSLAADCKAKLNHNGEGRR